MSQPRPKPVSPEVMEELSARIEREVRESILGKPRIPEGTVTILFTDVEGSTELLRDFGERAAHAVLRRHDELLRAVIEGCGGVEVEHPGDSFMVAFPTARAGLTCALKIQRALEVESVTRPETPKVRIGIDTGEVITEEHGYFGSTVFRASRIADIAAGGQILGLRARQGARPGRRIPLRGAGGGRAQGARRRPPRLRGDRRA